MSELQVTQLISKMQSMASEARSETQQILETRENFGTIFKDALEHVNQLQQNSSDLKTRFELGDDSVSLSQAIIAGQKAGIAFEATLQVRNKLVQAYQDIMNMPV